MGKFVKWSLFTIAVLGFALGPLSNQSLARTFQVFDRPLDLHGFVTQETAWRTGSLESFHNVSDYFTAQLEAAYVLNEHVEFYGIFRFFYDWAYNINSGHDWWEKGGSPSRGGYAGSRDNMAFELRDGRDRDLGLPRELYVDIHLGNLDLRLGKQQVVWGETDGLRLMDIINPCDWQREFILRDSDEGFESTRIPLWLLRGEYFFDKPWFGGLLNDHSIEVVINPGDREGTRFNIGGGKASGFEDNGYLSTLGDYTNEGGPWAFPDPKFPWWYQAVLNRHKADRDRWFEYAIRFKGQINEWYFTLNGFYGRQQFPILKWTHTSVRWGVLSALGYTEVDDFFASMGMTPVDDADFVNNGMHVVQANFDYEFQHQKVLGFTLNKDLVNWIHIWNSSPVLRVEALYEFDKPFNSMGKTMDMLQWSGAPTTLTLGAVPFDGIVHKDQIRYMVGYDWQMWCKFLNPHETFFTSLQFSHYHIRHMGNDKLVMAPFIFDESVVHQGPPAPGNLFGFSNPGGVRDVLAPHLDPWRIKRNQYYFTYLVFTKYDHARIIPQVLYVSDLTANAYWVKAKVNFNYGDHWRPEIGTFFIHGNSDTGESFGLFNHCDQVYLKIKYLFN